MSKRDETTTADGVFAIFALAQIIPCWIWKGYVLVVLWKWFIVPMGLPELHIPQMLGISITVALLSGISSVRNSLGELQKGNDDETSTKLGRLLLDWLAPGIILIEGWVLIHW